MKKIYCALLILFSVRTPLNAMLRSTGSAAHGARAVSRTIRLQQIKDIVSQEYRTERLRYKQDEETIKQKINRKGFGLVLPEVHIATPLQRSTTGQTAAAAAQDKKISTLPGATSYVSTEASRQTTGHVAVPRRAFGTRITPYYEPTAPMTLEQAMGNRPTIAQKQALKIRIENALDALFANVHDAEAQQPQNLKNMISEITFTLKAGDGFLQLTKSDKPANDAAYADQRTEFKQAFLKPINSMNANGIWLDPSNDMMLNLHDAAKRFEQTPDSIAPNTMTLTTITAQLLISDEPFRIDSLMSTNPAILQELIVALYKSLYPPTAEDVAHTTETTTIEE